MSLSTMNPPKLSFAGSNLQVTGKATGSGKRQVKQALRRTYPFNPVEELIARIKLHTPKDVLDEIRKDEKKEVEAITKLWNEALAGPLKGHITDEGRLEHAKKYFATDAGKGWMRDRFLPHAIDSAPSAVAMPVHPSGHNAATDTAINPGPLASVTDDPVVQLVNEVMSGNIPTASIPPGAINDGASGLWIPPVGQVVEVPMQTPERPVSVTSQVAGPVATGLALVQHRRARSDAGLNIICHNCGNIHSQTAGLQIEEGTGLRGIEINNGTMMRKLVRKAWTPVMYILVGVGLAQLMNGYPKA